MTCNDIKRFRANHDVCVTIETKTRKAISGKAFSIHEKTGIFMYDIFKEKIIHRTLSDGKVVTESILDEMLYELENQK